ncbi:glycerophosphodiester phosphodiesterase family protein [Pistricoccus aurantiacus]|uniref:glycerophosphodiester phosphodiesterase family protein n=1 Tax=Pistricoccus aurantiacus TaxID=1883414 RepID=UPI00362D12D8
MIGSHPIIGLRRLSWLARDVSIALRDHLRPLLAYHLFFTLLASAILLPTTGWALAGLLKRLDRPVITSAGLLDILATPTGAAWLLAAIALTFLLLSLQQAGMILVTAHPRNNHYRLALQSLWAVTRRFPAVALLSLLQIGIHALLILPLIVVLVGFHGVFLGGLDSYYVRHALPPALWKFLAASMPFFLLWAWFAAKLYLRWRLALPILMLESRRPLEALRRSYRMTQGWGRHIGAAVLLLLLLIIVLPVAFTWLFDTLGSPLLMLLPERHAILLPATLAYVLCYVLLTLGLTFLGIAANSLLMACLYLRLMQPLADQHRFLSILPANGQPGRLAWGIELAVLVFAAAQAWGILNSFELRDDVTITAHRGSSLAAPENTLAAISRAYEDGADMVEIDVRFTRDDQVVVFHDNQLRRLTGDPRRLRDVDLKELRGFDVGSWFGDAFVGEGIPTLVEALKSARGKGALMIELKPDRGRSSDLIEAVFGLLDAENTARAVCRLKPRDQGEACGSDDVFDDVRLASLSESVIREVEERRPEVRTTLLAEFILSGTLDRSGFDALGLRYNRINRREVALARRLGYELHAWTTNSPGRMSALIDLGVDNIITDRPATLAELLEERRQLSDGELLLLKIHNWLRF